MGDWPGNPVASMQVRNYGGGTSSEITWDTTISNSQTVSEINIRWTIPCSFDDHPNWDNGRGFFRARLYRLSDAGSWDQLGSQEFKLGNDDDDGYYTGTLTVSATMVREIELYRLDLDCGTRDTSLGTDVSKSLTFTAIQGSAYVGDFSLDYLPISIVYCPPDQDMSASLSQTIEYGTRTTIGTSEGFQAQTGAGVEVSALGVKLGGVSTTESHSVTNRSEAGIEFSYFRNTVLTADNQRAIGRAYWGPLGDIFVIAVNPRFAVSRRADGTLFYANKSMDQIVVVPAYKMLRPGADEIVATIPDDVRRRILEMDPFLQNLNLFFPDSGAALEQAANPFADPAVGNRAECLGRWWLDNGTELNYSIGESKRLKSGETTEVQFQSTVTVEVGFTINLFDVIGIGAQVQNSFTTSIGYQSSKETVAGSSTTASAYLIRNQNEKDLSGIEIYFDKIFSTLMFRKVVPSPLCVGGTVISPTARLVDRLGVSAIAASGRRYETTTDRSGRYVFTHLTPGTYTLVAGDQRQTVEVAERHPIQPSTTRTPSLGNWALPCLVVHLKDVRRLIDFRTSPGWVIASELGITSEEVWRISRNLHAIVDERDLGTLLGLDDRRVRERIAAVAISWPATPVATLRGVQPDEAANLRKAEVASLQELWHRSATEAGMREVAERSGIPRERLQSLRQAVEATRASVTKKDAPSAPRPRSLLGRIQPSGRGADSDFASSKRYRTLVGRR